MNFIIDDDNWQHLNNVPRGERSRWVNEALVEHRRRSQRRKAARAMDALAESLAPVEGRAHDWLHDDRRRDG